MQDLPHALGMERFPDQFPLPWTLVYTSRKEHLVLRNAFLVAVADPVRSKVVNTKVNDSGTCWSGSSCTFF
jgi:hypothetical protein